MRIIATEGHNFLLEKFLTTTDLYLGLWGAITLDFPRLDISLSSWSKVYEITFNEYVRKKIKKGDWVYNTALEVYENLEFSFLPQTQNWINVCGYFISTSADNTGELFSLTKFDSAKTILKGVVTPEYVIIPRFSFKERL